LRFTDNPIQCSAGYAEYPVTALVATLWSTDVDDTRFLRETPLNGVVGCVKHLGNLLRSEVFGGGLGLLFYFHEG